MKFARNVEKKPVDFVIKILLEYVNIAVLKFWFVPCALLFAAAKKITNIVIFVIINP